MIKKIDLPTGEDLTAFFGIFFIAWVFPLTVALTILGLILSWSLLTTLLLIVGGSAAIIVLMVSYGFISTYFHGRKNKKEIS